MAPRIAVPLVFLSLLLTSCQAVGPDYRRPQEPIPISFKDKGPWREAVPSDTLTRGPWWELYQDASLNLLEKSALRGNLRLQVALTRVEQARALVRATDADRAPKANIDAQAGRIHASENRPDEPTKVLHEYSASLYRVPLTASYEIDLWGKLKRSSESALARQQATEAAYVTVLFSLQAEVALTYFSIRTLDSEAALVREGVQLRARSRDLVLARVKGGLSSELDLTRADAELATASAELFGLQRRRAELEGILAVLLGMNPEEFTLPEWVADLRVPAVPPGLPSDLLERRPDIAEAERLLAARNAEIGVAKAAFFPSIRLTGMVGFESVELDKLFDRDSPVWSVGPSISLPLLDGGRRRADMDRAKAAFDEQMAFYREKLLVAFREVESGLSGLRFLSEQSDTHAVAVSSARKSVKLAEARFRSGLALFLEVADAQRTALAAERVAAQIRGQQLATSVALIRALGGGWSQNPS
jgi:multidrug efflux system outer membrane protein